MLTAAFFGVVVIIAVLTAAAAVRSTRSGPVQRLTPLAGLVVAAVLWIAWSGTWRIVPAVIVVLALVALLRSRTHGLSTAAAKARATNP